MNGYAIAIAVLLVLLAAAVALVLIQRGLALRWKDAYDGEVRLHDETRDTLAAVKAELAIVHDDYARDLRELNRRLVLAEGLARAAERMHS